MKIKTHVKAAATEPVWIHGGPNVTARGAKERPVPPVMSLDFVSSGALRALLVDLCPGIAGERIDLEDGGPGRIIVRTTPAAVAQLEAVRDELAGRVPEALSVVLATFYKCAGSNCPGYAYRASERAHPTSCLSPEECP